MDGLQKIGLEPVRLHGSSLRAKIAEAVTSASLDRTIDGSSTLRISALDGDRELIKSDLFNSRVSLVIDELVFEFTGYGKSGNSLELLFESGGVADLRRQKGARIVAPKTTTRTEFAQRLVSDVKWLAFQGDPGDKAKTVMARGKRETSWEALQRLGPQERQWRCFEDKGTIYFGSDEWLESLVPPFVISEDLEWVDSIDPSYNGGQSATECTISCLAKRWAFRPGSPININGLGELASKKLWLVQSISRDLFSPQATITLTRRVPELPEPKPEPKVGSLGDPTSSFPAGRAGLISELQKGYESVGRDDLAALVEDEDFWTWVGAESGGNPQNVSEPNNNGKVNGGLFQFWAGHSWAVPYFSKGIYTSYAGGNRFTMSVFDQAVATVQYFALTVAEVHRYAAAIRAGTYEGWG